MSGNYRNTFKLVRHIDAHRCAEDTRKIRVKKGCSLKYLKYKRRYLLEYSRRSDDGLNLPKRSMRSGMPKYPWPSINSSCVVSLYIYTFVFTFHVPVDGISTTHFVD